MKAGSRDAWTMVLAASAFATLFALSFVATPVKFLAANVPIEHLLAVGRVTFRASLGVESVIVALLLLIARGRVRWLVMGSVAVLLAQWLILMPRLDERTLARMAGAILESSALHHWWIVLDIARLAIYAVILHKAQHALRPTQPNDRLRS